MGVKLGDFIKKLREDKQLTLREASKRLDIAEAYLWQLENNKRGVPRPEMLKKLSDGYGVPPETLLKHAGYAMGQEVDEKQKVEAKKKVLFRDYDKLSAAGKENLELLMRVLQEKDSKK